MTRASQDAAVHLPVLTEEALTGLAVRANGIYIDGTYGRGGHSGVILQRLEATGRLIAIDTDPQAVEQARIAFGEDSRFGIEAGSFTQMRAIGEREGLLGSIDGMLLDLGVSSPQLDDAQRGFSFLRDGPLDMRMDPGRGTSAADWLGSASEGEIARVLRVYGEERFSRRIARMIAETRRQAPIVSTAQLAALVAAAVPVREQGKHPATRTFLAIRILVNDELEELRRALTQAPDLLRRGGRLVVISFHSLEDRIVKRFMRREARGVDHPPGLPLRDDQLGVRLRVVGKPVRPSAAELHDNPRARSAVLRVAERW